MIYQFRTDLPNLTAQSNAFGCNSCVCIALNQYPRPTTSTSSIIVFPEQFWMLTRRRPWRYIAANSDKGEIVSGFFTFSVYYVSHVNATIFLFVFVFQIRRPFFRFWDYNNIMLVVVRSNDVTVGPIVFYFFFFWIFWGIRNWRARLGKRHTKWVSFHFDCFASSLYFLAEPGLSPDRNSIALFFFLAIYTYICMYVCTCLCEGSVDTWLYVELLSSGCWNIQRHLTPVYPVYK